MKLTTKLAAGAAMSALTLGLGAAYAQETTSSIRGTVLTPGGAPAAGETVTITDTRTGNTRSVQTNAAGIFTARGLRVGGPYIVDIDSSSFADERVTDIFLNLGETYTLNVAFDAGTAATDEIVITATAAEVAQVAIGPSATFNRQDLETLPAINRDIRDIIRTDPRIYLNTTNDDAVQCAGANNRFNSLTLDGVRYNDGFGLNANGFPTERVPFSFDAIEQVAVELSPFDVEYGGFSACNINAVTKSGSNEFSGGFFFDYTDQNLTGDSLEGDSVRVDDFDEIRYGATLGGPIIKDRLFFFASYEALEGSNTFDRGPEGSGAIQEIVGFSQADFDRIDQIARDVYGYETGGLPGGVDNEDEKILIKLDWNIIEGHRASFTYNYNDGFNNVESDGDANEFEYANHLYERGTELESYAGSLFSDWTDNFSTEIRVSYNDVDPRVESLGGSDFGEVQIRDDGNIIYIGGDDSRQANELDYSVFNMKFKGDYQWNNHLFTFGYERETFDVFNLFIQEAEGEYRFSSIDDFEAGIPNRITYENAAGTNNPADGAGEFEYSVNTVYLQDEFLIPSAGLTVVAGLRYDWYTTDDAPALNQNFVNTYGFANNATLDGEGLLQPRLGFTWEADPSVTVRGGFGLYSGGNPNVWLSNNYSNNGVTLFEYQDRSGTPLSAITFNGDGQPIFDIPVDAINAVAAGTGTGPVNALDPDFEIPSEWKVTLGATWLADFDVPYVGGEYVFNADFLYTDANNSAQVQNLGISVVGTGPLGEPIYAGSTDDYVLTNSVGGGDGINLAFSVSKDYDNGFDWTLGYAYSDTTDISPMTSSVAFSNTQEFAYLDPNRPVESTSNYNIPHRITIQANYERAFFQDYATRFSLFGSINEGRPYSYVFSRNSLTGFFQDRNSTLLYVPSGPGAMDDPNVMYATGFDLAGFNAFLAENDLDDSRGSFTSRNDYNSDWWAKFDLRFEQELPGVLQGHRSAAFFIIENVGNLLNDEWGILNEASFPLTVPVVDASYSADNSQFIFEEFRDPTVQPRVGRGGSLWEMRVGFRYEF